MNKKHTKAKNHNLSITNAGSSNRAVEARRTPTEQQEHKALVTWLSYRFEYYEWIHPPNEQKAGSDRIGILKAMGMKRGFPDFIIFRKATYCFDAHGCTHFGSNGDGMVLELKRQFGRKPNKDQLAWLDFFKSIGWATAVAYGAQDAINKIEEVYGKL
jgi:hypothetical protein